MYSSSETICACVQDAKSKKASAGAIREVFFIYEQSIPIRFNINTGGYKYLTAKAVSFLAPKVGGYLGLALVVVFSLFCHIINHCTVACRSGGFVVMSFTPQTTTPEIWPLSKPGKLLKQYPTGVALKQLGQHAGTTIHPRLHHHVDMIIYHPRARGS